MSFGPLTGNASEELLAAGGDVTELKESFGFMVNIAGTLRCRLRGDSADRDLVLLASIIYPIDLKNVTYSAGTVGPTIVWIFRQGMV